MTSNLLPKQGEVYFESEFFTQDEADEYLKLLTDEIRWNQEPIIIFGKKLMQPRLTAWYGDAGIKYGYSGIKLEAIAWTSALKTIKSKLESFSGETFNSVLLNYYRNERDSMGWHRDDEKELGVNPVIASVSFGETRRFKLKHRIEKELRQTIELSNGSLLLMRGETQHHWLHEVPKETHSRGPRINLTFRKIKIE
jgi:alkylated DNA repair dioxygenase AlkB